MLTATSHLPGGLPASWFPRRNVDGFVKFPPLVGEESPAQRPVLESSAPCTRPFLRPPTRIVCSLQPAGLLVRRPSCRSAETRAHREVRCCGSVASQQLLGKIISSDCSARLRRQSVRLLLSQRQSSACPWPFERRFRRPRCAMDTPRSAE
jgi:hypothetical protein